VEWMRRLAEEGVHLLDGAPSKIRGDREVTKHAMRIYPWALHDACDELRADKELGLLAVEGLVGRALCGLLGAELQADRELVLKAVQHW